MRYKLLALLMVVVMGIGFTGCSKKTGNMGEDVDQMESHKIMVVVCDSESKAPIKEAKVYLLGSEDSYTTDEMGKTPEIQVNLNKDYFGRYSDEVSGRMGSGFVNVVALKDGYGKHIELDYSVYPGSSIYLVKIELKKGSKNTVKVNSPDVENVENILKAYEKFEGGGIKSDNMVKYSVTLKDGSGKPLQDAKIVIPEAQLSAKTNQKGVCQLEIPYDDTSVVNYPVKKEYGEITILTYKEEYPSMVLLRTPVNKDGKDNSITIKLKKAEKGNVKYDVVEPQLKWVNQVFESYK